MWSIIKRKNKDKNIYIDNLYNVLDISRYIINYSNQQGYGISNLKLQKILYFVQAYFF